MPIENQLLTWNPLDRNTTRFDKDGIAEQFTSNHTRLIQVIRTRMDHRLQGRVDPEDILQEAFLDALKRISHFHDRISIFVQIRQILLQTLIDVHRRHLVVKARTVVAETNHRPASQAQSSITLVRLLKAKLPSPSSPIQHAETCFKVSQAIETLGEMDCEVLLMRHFEDMSNQEIAESLNIKPVTASRRYLRALGRLKETLESLSHFAD